MTRLRPFSYTVARGQEQRVVTFYALTEAVARAMAAGWCRPGGWASTTGLWAMPRELREDDDSDILGAFVGRSAS